MVENGLVGQISIGRFPGFKIVEFRFLPLTREHPPSGEHVLVKLNPGQFKLFMGHYTQHLAEGKAQFHIKGGKITEMRFFPFGDSETTRAIKPPRGSKVGTLVHHAVVEYLADNFPNHVVHHDLTNPEKGLIHGTSKERIGHLRKIGINPERDTPIEEYQQITRRHMEKEFGMRF